MPSCIFCNSNDSSKEHLWGAWWQDYYPPKQADRLQRGTHTITTRSDSDVYKRTKGQFSNVGAPISHTTKVVCEECNTGWMSIIESDMKEAFHSLYIENNDIVSPDFAVAIKKWMFLKFCLLDRSYSAQDVLIPSNTINASLLPPILNNKRTTRWLEFEKGTTIPSSYRFYITRSTNEHFKIGSFNHIPMPLFQELNTSEPSVSLFDTCMFFNGHFIGVVTNHPILKEHLSNILLKKINPEPFIEVNDSNPCMPKNSCIHGSQFEEMILSKLEGENTNFYRRNFAN